MTAAVLGSRSQPQSACPGWYAGGMSRPVAFALMLAVVFATSARGQVRTAPWSPSEPQQFDALDSLLCAIHDWDDLQRAYAVLLPYDDGHIAEGISDFVVQRLAKRWRTFPELAAMAEADTAFGSWVVLHIDATTDWDDLARIERHAGRRGPTRFAAFRRRVLAAAHAANIEAHKAVDEGQRSWPPHAP